MIEVKRNSLAPQVLNLDDERSRASRELKKASLYFNNLPNDDKKPKFSVYSHKSVKGLLEEETHGKCVYCECEVSAGSDGDVEHYRPKGSVAEEKDNDPSHPGYWWLAMDWSNLVLSCQHCNQIRKHILYFPGMTEADLIDLIRKNKTISAGKLDSFPVKPNTRAFNKSEIQDEVPLLINPIIENPDEHIEWVFTNDLPMPVPKNNSELGVASIAAYALYRSKLSKRRKIIFIRLKILRQRVIECINKIENENDDHELGKLWGILEASMDALKDRGDDSEPYAGMARAYFNLVESEVSSLLADG